MLDLLSGIRVVDLTTVVLGPYATQMLADFGAEVIKVEPRGGDIFRSARPGHAGGDGAGFLNLNRNKKSIALDLGKEEDKQTLTALVATADVFVHNIRRQSAAKLGIDFDAIRRWKPDIIYAWARGYGQGPYEDEPAYDDCIQAVSGLAWLNANENGEPRFVRTILCDKVAGLHLAFAIAAGLAARARSGEGCQVETPMYETMASFLLIEQLSGQTFIPALPDRGYERLNAPGRKPYKTADGYVAIMPYTSSHWLKFLKIVEEGALCATAWVRDSEQRSLRVAELYNVIEKHAAKRTTHDWLNCLRAADIPCAPVNKLEDLPADAQLLAGDLFRSFKHPREGDLQYVSNPITSRTADTLPDQPAPVLDADRADILKQLKS